MNVLAAASPIDHSLAGALSGRVSLRGGSDGYPGRGVGFVFEVEHFDLSGDEISEHVDGVADPGLAGDDGDALPPAEVERPSLPSSRIAPPVKPVKSAPKTYRRRTLSPAAKASSAAGTRRCS